MTFSTPSISLQDPNRLVSFPKLAGELLQLRVAKHLFCLDLSLRCVHNQQIFSYQRNSAFELVVLRLVEVPFSLSISNTGCVVSREGRISWIKNGLDIVRTYLLSSNKLWIKICSIFVDHVVANSFQTVIWLKFDFDLVDVLLLSSTFRIFHGINYRNSWWLVF